MSWKATYWVKTLTHHPDGQILTARQKLVLFVLADYHHEEKGFAWVSIRRAAKEALTSPQWFCSITQSLEKHGTLEIEKRDGKSNLYRFPALCKPLEQSPKNEVPNTNTVLQSRVEHTVQVQTRTEPLYPSVTDISAASRHVNLIDWAIRESRKTKIPADELMRQVRAGEREAIGL